MTIGTRIEKERKRLKLTQEELAAALNVSRQSISKWEQDAVMPDLENIINLSKVLGVSVEYLTMGKENDNSVKLSIKDYIAVGIGIIFVIFSLVMIIINRDSLSQTSSIIYLNGYHLLAVIGICLIIFGIVIVYKRKNERK